MSTEKKIIFYITINQKDRKKVPSVELQERQIWLDIENKQAVYEIEKTDEYTQGLYNLGNTLSCNGYLASPESYIYESEDEINLVIIFTKSKSTALSNKESLTLLAFCTRQYEKCGLYQKNNEITVHLHKIVKGDPDYIKNDFENKAIELITST